MHTSISEQIQSVLTARDGSDWLWLKTTVFYSPPQPCCPSILPLKGTDVALALLAVTNAASGSGTTQALYGWSDSKD